MTGSQRQAERPRLLAWRAPELRGLGENLSALRRGAGPWLAIAFAILAAAVLATGIPGASQLGGGVSRVVPFVDVVLAAAVGALLVASPWEGLLAWIVLTPLLNMGQSQAVLGPLQVIYPSVFLPAFVVGWLRRLSIDGGLGTGLARLPVVARTAWVLVAIVAVLSVASLVATNDGPGAMIVLYGVLEPAVIAAAIVSFLPTRRQVAALLLALGASSVLATALTLLRAGRLTVTNAEALRGDMARFVYFNVGIFGDILAMSLPLLVGAVLLRRDLRLSRVVAAVLAVGALVSLAGLYATHSKSAWLGAAAAILVVVVLGLRSMRLRAAVVVAAVVVSALVVPWPLAILNAAHIDAGPYTRLVERFQGSRINTWDPATTEGEVSITERFYATEAAVRMAADHPLLGVGAGRFQDEYQARYYNGKATRELTSAHNLVPEIAAEFGIPMAALVLGVLLAAVGGLFAVLRRNGVRRENDPSATPADGATGAAGGSGATDNGGGPMARALAAMLIASIVGFAIVATTFGVDLYRDYRLMNSDVLAVGLLLGAAGALVAAARSGRDAS